MRRARARSEARSEAPTADGTAARPGVRRGPGRRAARWMVVIAGIVAVAAVTGAAGAQIGRPVEAIAETLSLDARAIDGERVETEAGVEVQLVERGRALGSVRVWGTLDDDAIVETSLVLGVAGTLEPGLVGAIADFLRTRLDELAGEGPVEIGVGGTYRLRLEVEGEAAPFRVALAFGPEEVEAEALPAGRHTLGPADAPIVVREFSDFQCPACRRFALTVMADLEEALLARGDVRFEYHHFPLQSIHANAFRAAEASECAADAAGDDAAGPAAGAAAGPTGREGDGFWRFHDALFETQAAWAPLADPDAHFVGLAEAVGIDGDAVAACLSEGLRRADVEEAYRAAVDLRLRGTPSLFVDGFPVADFASVEAFLERIAWIRAFGEEPAP